MLGFIHTDSNKKVMKRKKILAIYIYISKFSYKLKKKHANNPFLYNTLSF